MGGTSDGIVGSRPSGENAARAGMTLLEIAISVTVLSITLLGVMASLSSGFIANNQNEEFLRSQMLAQQVLQEIQDNAYDDLLSFNGQYVASSTLRADITVSTAGADLVRVQVDTTSTAYSAITCQAVTFVADLD